MVAQIPQLVDRCGFVAVSNGTADFVVSSNVTGFMTPANAGLVDQRTYSYFAQNTAMTEWEVGQGVYTVGSTTLARTTVLFSSNSNAKVSFTLAPSVYMDLLSEDFVTILAPFTGAAFGSI